MASDEFAGKWSFSTRPFSFCLTRISQSDVGAALCVESQEWDWWIKSLSSSERTSHSLKISLSCQSQRYHLRLIWSSQSSLSDDVTQPILLSHSFLMFLFLFFSLEGLDAPDAVGVRRILLHHAVLHHSTVIWRKKNQKRAGPKRELCFYLTVPLILWKQCACLRVLPVPRGVVWSKADQGVCGGVGEPSACQPVSYPFSPYNTMTTAVQSNELVFEFASNGMDEINQVHHSHVYCFLRYQPFIIDLKTLILIPEIFVIRHVNL